VCFFAAKPKRAKSRLPDEFSQKMFPITPPGNGNVGLGPRDLSECGFKVAENSPPPKIIASKICAKITTFLGHEYFILFKLKLRYFVQEFASKFTIFISFVKKFFFQKFCFLTDTVANLAVR
jgi:hypothetical protein